MVLLFIFLLIATIGLFYFMFDESKMCLDNPFTYGVKTRLPAGTQCSCQLNKESFLKFDAYGVWAQEQGDAWVIINGSNFNGFNGTN